MAKTGKYRCYYPKCEFRTKRESTLLNHYKKEHPEVKITEKENGSFEVDLNGIDKVKNAEQPKSKESKTDKTAESKKSKAKMPNFEECEKWSELDEDTQTKILEWVEKGIADGSMTWSGTRREIALHWNVSVWPYTVRGKIDSEFAEARKQRRLELSGEVSE